MKSNLFPKLHSAVVISEQTVGLHICLVDLSTSLKMSKYPSVSRLVAINAVVCGLEIAACVAFTFIPPLLLKANIQN